MRKIGTKTLLSIFLVFLFVNCDAILNGHESVLDITAVPMFGCQWSGGVNVMVRCTCTPDAEEFIIRKGQIHESSTWGIEIDGCKKVAFNENSIEDLRNLRNLHLKNIPSLTFEEQSINWFGYGPNYQEEDEQFDDVSIPSVKITIENCGIEKFSQLSVSGRINEILISGGKIETINSFAFSSLKQIRIITLKNVVINSMKPQSFKNFAIKELLLDNVTVKEIPSRSFQSIAVGESFQVKNSVFEYVRPSAFMVDDPKYFELSNCKIDNLNGEAFSIRTKGNVVVKNNYIGAINDGAFGAIKPNKEEVFHKVYFTFENNFFSSLSRNSLQIADFIPKIVNLTLAESCDCEKIFTRFDDFSDFYDEISCVDGDKHTSLKDYKSYNCTVLAGYTTTVIIVSVIFALCIIVGIVIFVYYRKVYLMKTYGDKKTTNGKNMSLIVPDGRTYRETELHVIVERADLLTTDL